MNLKRVPLILGVILCIFQSSYANSITAKKVISPVAVDGHLEESFWDITNQLTVVSYGTTDNTAYFGVLWDAEYLYVGVKVSDPNLVNDGRVAWHNDGFEICIDGDNNKGTNFDSFDRHFVKPFNSYWIQERDGQNSNVKHKWNSLEDGYSMEIAIPWANFGMTPVAGDSIGFDVAVNDDDNGAYCDGRLIWTGTDNYYKDPSLWGDLLLSAETVSFAADYIALLAPKNGDFLVTDKTHVVEWVSSGFDNINVECSTDSGTSWITVASNLSATPAYFNWQVDAAPSENCLIRISDTNNSLVHDISKEVFTISDILTSVGPLITDIWHNYRWPYNAYFPEASGGINGHIGNACGHTSLARILHYWEFPIIGNDALTFTDNGGYTWSANFGGATYKYDNMPASVNSGSSEAEYTDIATLVYHAATSMHDRYGSGTDMNNMAYAMRHYFNYSNAHYVSRYNYTKAEWISLLKSELDEGRIVLVQGMSLYAPGEWHEGNNVAGHWYLCDGYNSNGEFHLQYGYGDFDYFYDVEEFADHAYDLNILLGLEPSLEGKQVKVLAPNGGELFSNARETEITWNSENISNIRLEYTVNNGLEWQEINSSIIAEQGKYNWYLPEIVSDQCKIRLSETSNINVYDRSDTTFEIVNDSLQAPLYFTNYDTFISKLTNLTSSSDSSAQLDLFWDELIGTGNFPFAINTKVAFLYRGSATGISIAGMFNDWDMNADPAQRLGISDIWILEKEFPADTRCEYKIVKNGSEWLADPNNPNPLVGDYQNSELWMPDYDKHTELIARTDIAKGTLSNNIQKNSSNLGYLCQYRVYTPAGYDALSNLAVVYVTDGQNYLDDSMGKMVTVLDNMIADEIINPLIVVFLDPRDPNDLSTDRRFNEYRNSINFANYVKQELIPDIDAAYKTNPSADARAIMGASYGGYNAEYFSVVAADYFHNIGMNSPYLHPNGDYNILGELQAAPLDKMVLYLSYGIFDADAERYCNDLKGVFDQKGKDYKLTIIGDGHTWQNWSRVIGDALEYFFAKSETAFLSLTYPKGGDYIISGSLITITWNYELVSNIRIDFSEDNATTWQKITASIPANEHSYEWTVPDISSDQCLIKISDAANESLYDLTDDVFTIGEIKSIGGPYEVDDHTILLLHFENDLTNTSEKSSDGVMHGNNISYTSSVNSALGQCIGFNNSNSSNKNFITIPYSSALSLSNNWTIELWLYIESWDMSHNNWPVPFVLPTSGWDANYFLEIPAAEGRLKYGFKSSAGGVTLYSSQNSITTGKWYHVALLNDYDNHKIELKIHDSELQQLEEQSASYSAGIMINTGTSDLRIGAGLDVSNYLNGYIDEMRISDVVRDFTVGIEDNTGIPLKSIVLHQNYPNPFNPTTQIKYDLPENGFVKVTVFDIQGKMIKTLVNGYRTTGNHSVNFYGNNLSSGIYFYTIKAGSFNKTKKMILIQ